MGEELVNGGGASSSPALQVIVLGSGGGPLENNTTAFLVRSLASGWSRGSVVAVDAGVHLGAIARILDETQPSGLGEDTPLPHTLSSGPFAGLEVSHADSSANAAHVTRHLVDTYLITHPHLDHISGFVVNTAGLPGARPKRLAGLPSTISAFKNHIFNNVIWPNLSDENNGAGLVTYMRLVEGGSPALGEGEGKGYIELNDGLSVKMWGVSHGHCIERHSHRGSSSSSGPRPGSFDASTLVSPRHNTSHGLGHHNTPASAPMSRAPSLLSHASLRENVADYGENVCVYDSSAYFIRDIKTGREVLIFGDVEPDSISLSPRNIFIWKEAAPKIASGSLAAIFIECSYDDSQSVDRLFGHLKPCFVMEELKVLAAEVGMARLVQASETRKRKRSGPEDGPLLVGRQKSNAAPQTDGTSSHAEDPVSPRTVRPVGHSGKSELSPRSQSVVDDVALDRMPVPFLHSNSLQGLKVVLIHVKDRLANGPRTQETILEELQDYEAEAKLGCEFVISSPGQSLLL